MEVNELANFFFKELHLQMGHQSLYRIHKLIKERLVIKKIRGKLIKKIIRKINSKILECDICRSNNTLKKNSYHRPKPGIIECLCIDFCKILEGKWGEKVLCGILDRFSKYIKFYAIRKTSYSIQKILRECTYGASYEHHNSEIERAFRTVRAIYKKLPIKSKNVQKNLNKVAHIINTAEHKYLQCSPNTLVLRYNPRLRADNLMNLKINNDSQGEKFNELQYVLEKWKDRPSYPVNSEFNEEQTVYFCRYKVHPKTEKGKILYKNKDVTKIQLDRTNDKRQCNWTSNAKMKPAFVNNKEE
uniref:Integrase catalytic domain-containing protein n=1 Tax=Strongyloides venezuelensis TaxID=75913 RepID=A0A0K0FQY4_STRVS